MQKVMERAWGSEAWSAAVVALALVLLSALLQLAVSGLPSVPLFMSGLLFNALEYITLLLAM